MFYSFFIREDHRNYLRFVGPEDNDLDKELVDYRMNVHIFGNSPYPAVATYGMHRMADVAEPDAGSVVKHFVKRNFYVDDGLSSHPTSSEAVDLLKRTQRRYKTTVTYAFIKCVPFRCWPSLTKKTL